jgi:hypothetical protein
VTEYIEYASDATSDSTSTKTTTGSDYPAIASATAWLSGPRPDRHSFNRLCVAENNDHSALTPFSPRNRNRSHPRVTCWPNTGSTV